MASKSLQPYQRLAFLALLGCWLMTLLGPLYVIGVLGPFVLAAWLWNKNRKWAWGCALISPLVLATAVPIGLFFGGKATLRFHGLPGMTSFNVDRETRLAWRGGGCLLNGSEWLSDGWNNLVLQTCVTIFGPARNSPLGPYPSDEELTGNWSSAESVPMADLMKGSATLNGKEYSIPRSERLLDVLAPWRDLEEYGKTDVLAKDFGKGSFALRFISGSDFESEATGTTVLFGGSPTKVMGYFSPPGKSTFRYPPVRPGT